MTLDITVKRFGFLSIIFPVQRSGYDNIDRQVLELGDEGVVHFQLLDYGHKERDLSLSTVFSITEYADWSCKTDRLLGAMRAMLEDEDASVTINDVEVTLYRSAANKNFVHFVAPCGDEFRIELSVIQRLVDELSIPNEREKVKKELDELRAYVNKQTEAWQT